MNRYRTIVIKSKKISTLWNLLFSYTSIIYVVVSGVVLVPLYLVKIPIELYGAWLATGNILNWVLAVDPGISTLVQQRVASSIGAGELKSTGAYIGVGLAITSVVILIALLVGFILWSQLFRLINVSETENLSILNDCFLIGLVGSLFMLLSFIAMNVIMGMQWSFTHGTINVFGNMGAIGITVWLLTEDYGLYAIAFGLLGRGFITCFSSFVAMILAMREHDVSLSLPSTTAREMLKLLSFTTFSKVSVLISRNIDALLVSRFLGPAAVPAYVLTRRGFSIAELFLNRSGNAIAPGISNLHGAGSFEKIRFVLNRLFRINLWVLGLAFGGYIALNDDFVRLWVGFDLFAGTDVSIALSFLLVFSVIVTILETICFALGDIKRSAVVLVFNAVALVISFSMGLYFFGLIGAVIGHIIIIALISGFYHLFSLRKYIKFSITDFKKLFIEGAFSVIIGGGLGFFFCGIRSSNWWEFALTLLVYSTLYMAIIAISRPLLRIEFNSMWCWVSSEINRRRLVNG